MSQNECEHIRPDGARCQAPLQTGRSFCFFHDPEQQEKRAVARRNGGFMRDRPPEPESNSMAALNLALIEVKKVDDIIPILVDTINLFRRGKITRAEAHAIISACGVMVRVFREKRQAEREARQAAEAVKAAEREIPGFNSQSRFSGTDERLVGHGFSHDGAQRTEPFQRREEVGQDQFHAAAGTRAPRPFPPEDRSGSGLSQKGGGSAPKEEPIIIDASKPWDLSQFGGKKPRISCVVPVFTSMRTGKIFDVNEPSPLDPPEHMLRDEFRRKPAAPTPAAPPASAEAAQCDATKAAKEHIVGGEDLPKRGEDLYQGTTSVVPKDAEEDQLRAAAGPRGPRSFSHKDGARDFAEEKGGGSATDKTADREPKDAKPKKDPNNPYSITTLLPDPPRPFESKPRDPCTDPPETPPPPKPKPGPRLHPWIEYWGLH